MSFAVMIGPVGVILLGDTFIQADNCYWEEWIEAVIL